MTTEEDVRRILDNVRDHLTRLPNVIGIGVTSADAADPDGDPAVAVYVRRKLPKSDLATPEIVPATVQTTIDGRTVEAPTRVIEIGEIKPG